MNISGDDEILYRKVETVPKWWTQALLIGIRNPKLSLEQCEAVAKRRIQGSL